MATDTEEGRRSLYAQDLDERLDDALEGTFPASDPVALTPRPPPDCLSSNSEAESN